MKRLTEYKKHGYTFHLYKREGQFAIFLGTKENSSSQNYEVIRILETEAGSRIIHDPKTNADIPTSWEAHERPPGDNEWGVRGWTYNNAKDALDKLNSLIHP